MCYHIKSLRDGSRDVAVHFLFVFSLSMSTLEVTHACSARRHPIFTLDRQTHARTLCCLFRDVKFQRDEVKQKWCLKRNERVRGSEPFSPFNFLSALFSSRHFSPHPSHSSFCSSSIFACTPSPPFLSFHFTTLASSEDAFIASKQQATSKQLLCTSPPQAYFSILHPIHPNTIPWSTKMF